MCGRLEETHSYSEKGILAPSPGPRWFIDHIEMRDEAGRQRATFLFLSFTGCEEGRESEEQELYGTPDRELAAPFT